MRPLATAVTRAPMAREIWTANVPTPPDAPLTSTWSPAARFASSRSACRAVNAASGTLAASSKARPGGITATVPSVATAYSA